MNFRMRNSHWPKESLGHQENQPRVVVHERQFVRYIDKSAVCALDNSGGHNGCVCDTVPLAPSVPEALYHTMYVDTLPTCLS